MRIILTLLFCFCLCGFPACLPDKEEARETHFKLVMSKSYLRQMAITALLYEAKEGRRAKSFEALKKLDARLEKISPLTKKAYRFSFNAHKKGTDIFAYEAVAFKGKILWVSIDGIVKETPEAKFLNMLETQVAAFIKNKSQSK